MAFLLMARIRVRSAMRASIPLFYEQSSFCSSFSLELYIYKFISYTLLYIEETVHYTAHQRGKRHLKINMKCTFSSFSFQSVHGKP